MFYYRPKLPNGVEAPIAWQIQLFFLTTSWPIKDVSSFRINFLDKLSIVGIFLGFCFINDGEFHYIYKNINDIEKALDGIPTYLILIELNFRIFHMCLEKNSFKKFIEEFYMKVYIEELSFVFIYFSTTRRGV